MTGNKEKNGPLQTGTGAAASQYVVFNIASEEYCIEILKVQEIIRMMPVTWLPRRPTYIIGVINLRGEIIPIIDLRIKFGLEKKEYNKFTRILIGQIDEKLMGMVVDGTSDVIELASEQLESAPGAVARSKTSEYIRGIARLGERVIILLDISRILREDELYAISDLPVPEAQAKD